MLAGGGGVNEGEGIVGGCASGHPLRRRWMFRRCYRGGQGSVGVRLRRDVLARMGGGPSLRADLGVVWRGGGGVRPIGTNTSHSTPRESSFAGSRIGRSVLWVCPGKEDGGFRP